MPHSLCMHRDGTRTRFDEGRDERIRLFHHQVAIQEQVAGRPQRGHHRWPQSQVGDEVSIHDIHVQQAGTAAGHRFSVGTQAGEVGGENGGRNKGHRFTPWVSG